MKNIQERLSRSLLILVGGAFCAYVLRLRMNGKMIAQTGYAEYNGFLLASALFLVVYIVFTYGIMAMSLPMLKRTLVAIGIMLLFGAHLFLKDDPTQAVYLADLTKVVGVALIILGPTGILISSKVKKKKADAKVQVIEV